jgi:hypothetical protein
MLRSRVLLLRPRVSSDVWMARRIVCSARSKVNSSSRPIRSTGYRLFLAAFLLVGCKTDCVYYPCPLFEAITVTVSTAGTAAPPPALAIGVGDSTPQAGLCDTLGVCHVLGSPGVYHLTITATGFDPRQVNVTVTGEAAGCNSCGHVDRQQLAIVLQPAL